MKAPSLRCGVSVLRSRFRRRKAKRPASRPLRHGPNRPNRPQPANRPTGPFGFPSKLHPEKRGSCKNRDTLLAGSQPSGSLSFELFLVGLAVVSTKPPQHKLLAGHLRAAQSFLNPQVHWKWTSTPPYPAELPMGVLMKAWQGNFRFERSGAAGCRPREGAPAAAGHATALPGLLLWPFGPPCGATETAEMR